MRVHIRFSHNEIGMLIEAKITDPPGDVRGWQVVEMQKYTSFTVRTYGWGNVSHVMSTDMQERAYLAFLRNKGVNFIVERHGVLCERT
jgi:hypothetical protein